MFIIVWNNTFSFSPQKLKNLEKKSFMNKSEQMRIIYNCKQTVNLASQLTGNLLT